MDTSEFFGRTGVPRSLCWPYLWTATFVNLVTENRLTACSKSRLADAITPSAIWNAAWSWQKSASLNRSLTGHFPSS
jgi:hypothetical protein